MTLKLFLSSIFLVALHLVHGHTGHDHHGSASSSSTECVSNHCHVQLSPDLLLRYRIHLPENYDSNNDKDCRDCKIKVQLIYDGYTWLGLGVSLHGGMVGSHAVIGQPGVSDPKLYYLDGKDMKYIKPSGDQALDEASIEFVEVSSRLRCCTVCIDFAI